MYKNLINYLGIIILVFTTGLSGQQTPMLTLEEAIYLSLRHSPEIKNANIDRITDKFSLLNAERNFRPKLQDLSTDATLTSSTLQTSQDTLIANISSGVKLNLAYGGNLGLTAKADNSNNMSTSLNFKQPLLKGFGRDIAQDTLLKARANEATNKLKLRQTYITHITKVISAYYEVVLKQNNLKTTNEALEKFKNELAKLDIEISTGQKAEADRIPILANSLTEQINLLNAQDDVRKARIALLEIVGMNPDWEFTVSDEIIIPKYALPSQEETINLVLQNDTNYNSALINMKSTEREVLISKNAVLPQVDLSLSSTLTKASSASAGNRNDSVSLNVSIPLDRVEIRQNITKKEIALSKARTNLDKQQRELVNKALDAYRGMQIQEKRLIIAKEALKQRKILDETTRIQHEVGELSDFQRIEEQNKYTKQQLDTLNSHISFIKQFAEFQALTGETLEHWDIKIVY